MNPCTCLVLVLLLVPLPAGARGDDRPRLRSFAEGDFYRAITEYKRHLHGYPGGPKGASATLRLSYGLTLGLSGMTPRPGLTLSF